MTLVILCISNPLYSQTKSNLTPEQTYMKYVKSFQTGNITEYKNFVDSKILKKIEQSPANVEPQKVIQMMSLIAPRNIEIVNSEMRGEKAVLKARGDLPGSSTKATGAIVLIQEKGKWKVSAEKWVAKSIDGKTSQSFSIGLD